MKPLMKIAVMLLTAFTLRASDQEKNQFTSFHVLHKQTYPQERWEETAYFLRDGDFKVVPYSNGVQFKFRHLQNNEEWRIEFGGPAKHPLRLGVYRNAKRNAFSENSPGFDLLHNHTGYNSLSAEFEILELKYNRQGEVLRFAANYILEQDSLGSIRFNSSIPIEKRFTQPQAEKITSVISVSKRDALTGELSESIVLTDENKTLRINPLPYGGDGFRVHLLSFDEEWIFDFAAPQESKLTLGKYETSSRYPFQGYDEAGIGISKSRSCSAMPVGFFEVTEIERNNDIIRSIQFNFSIETEEGELYKGTIEYLDPTPEPDNLEQHDNYSSDEEEEFEQHDNYSSDEEEENEQKDAKRA